MDGNVLAHISPDKVAAVRAEGGLPEEGGHELVRVDLVHLPLHRAPPLPRHETPLLKQFKMDVRVKKLAAQFFSNFVKS